MSILSPLVTAFPGLTAEQLDGLIVLAGFGLAAFAIYVVFQIARERGN